MAPRKRTNMVYVGNNWFRWRALRGILEAIEPIRERVGRIGLVGHGWDGLAPWAGPTLVEDAYYRDPAYLKQLRVEVLPPVRFDDVMPFMSRGVVSPVILRPLFDRLQLVTCRSFETPAASTIPLFAQEERFVTEVYGPEGAELTLPAREPYQKILDVLDRPQYLPVDRGSYSAPPERRAFVLEAAPGADRDRRELIGEGNALD